MIDYLAQYDMHTYMFVPCYVFIMLNIVCPFIIMSIHVKRHEL